jgi:hypothetical protein
MRVTFLVTIWLALVASVQVRAEGARTLLTCTSLDKDKQLQISGTISDGPEGFKLSASVRGQRFDLYERVHSITEKYEHNAKITVFSDVVKYVFTVKAESVTLPNFRSIEFYALPEAFLVGAVDGGQKLKFRGQAKVVMQEETERINAEGEVLCDAEVHFEVAEDLEGS